MELYLAEAIKRVKMLNDDITYLLNEEDHYSVVDYREESERIKSNYDYATTRRRVNEINNEILKIKKAINKANNETKIGVEDYTISDGLIKIAMIRNELTYHLESIARREKLTSKVDMRNDGIIYTETLYDPEVCKEYVKSQKELLGRIQMGIDRANLTTVISV